MFSKFLIIEDLLYRSLAKIKITLNSSYSQVFLRKGDHLYVNAFEIAAWRASSEMPFEALQESEWPTATPRDPLFGQYKLIKKERDYLRAEFASETGRLIKHIGELNTVIGELTRPASLLTRIAKAIVSRLRPRRLAKAIVSRLRPRRL